jgi:hypothetical protein
MSRCIARCMSKDMVLYIHTRYQEQKHRDFSVSGVLFEVVEGNCSRSDQTENDSFYNIKATIRNGKS